MPASRMCWDSDDLIYDSLKQSAPHNGSKNGIVRAAGYGSRQNSARERDDDAALEGGVQTAAHSVQNRDGGGPNPNPTPSHRVRKTKRPPENEQRRLTTAEIIDQLSPDAVKSLREFLWVDEALYTYFNNRFEAEVRAEGATFDTRLHAFRGRAAGQSILTRLGTNLHTQQDERLPSTRLVPHGFIAWLKLVNPSSFALTNISCTPCQSLHRAAAIVI